MILVGGANYHEIPPGVCIVDLISLVAYEFKLPVSTSILIYFIRNQLSNFFSLVNRKKVQLNDQNPLIAVCHQTHVMDKNTILMVGGGAVCFTFGTHLNKQPILIDLSECWTLISQKQVGRIDA